MTATRIGNTATASSPAKMFCGPASSRQAIAPHATASTSLIHFGFMLSLGAEPDQSVNPTKPESPVMGCNF